MKAFVSYQFGTDLSQILKLLRENNVDFYNSLSDIKIEESFKEAIINSIKDCDFIILVYNKENANLAFEAGIAAAIKKPIFSIISASRTSFPDFLMDDVHVLAGPLDYEKIKFSFQIFVSKIKPSKKLSKKTHRKETLNVEVNNVDWITQYQNLEIKNEKEIESFLEKIFIHFNISYSKKPNYGKGYLADFSIWSDKLTVPFGNPILVEVKSTVSTRFKENYQESFTDAVNKANAKFMFFFYDRISGSKEIFPISGNVIFIDVSKFIGFLNSANFEQAIIKYRNELIHNIFS